MEFLYRPEFWLVTLLLVLAVITLSNLWSDFAFMYYTRKGRYRSKYYEFPNVFKYIFFKKKFNPKVYNLPRKLEETFSPLAAYHGRFRSLEIIGGVHIELSGVGEYHPNILTVEGDRWILSNDPNVMMPIPFFDRWRAIYGKYQYIYVGNSFFFKGDVKCFEEDLTIILMCIDDHIKEKFRPISL
jgi:hypothetical protein